LFEDGAPQQLALSGTGVASVQDYFVFRALLDRAHAIATEQRFLHWQIAFPGVWRNWTGAEPEGGFDAVIGNPPWDRMKMQEVEWFAARAPQVAHQARATDRKKLIKEMKAAGEPLIEQYERAAALADKAMERARESSEYPLLSKGDVNIYALFVERAQALIKPNGIAGLLVPSGILSDAGSETFMKHIIQGKRFVLGLDFFNKRSDGTLFFPDVYYRFKFCIFVASGVHRKQEFGEAAFFVRDARAVPQLELVQISESKLQEINPGRFLLPIIKHVRDIEVVAAILHTKTAAPLRDAPVKYGCMFHMAADSERFLTIAKIEKEGGYPVNASLWKWQGKSLVRLFEGKMIQAFDHRAASLSFYKSNIFRTGEGESTTDEEHTDPAFLRVCPKTSGGITKFSEHEAD
jgi:hypothetical protein